LSFDCNMYDVSDRKEQPLWGVVEEPTRLVKP